jgi:hypothetical protein
MPVSFLRELASFSLVEIVEGENGEELSPLDVLGSPTPRGTCVASG